MKKFLCIIISMLLSFGVGCSSSDNAKTDDGKIDVYCSFYGIYDFVNEIGGDKINAYNMVPTGTEPHDWEPSTKDMADLTKADIIFYNGLGMEGWIDKVKSSVGDNVQFVELANGVVDESDAIDPHIWLDPNNAIKMCQNIENTLSQVDSANADFYKSNLDKYVADIANVDNQYKSTLSSVSNKKIVVAHEAYGYLCKAYGLEQVGIEGISADSEPSPSKMQELVNLIKEQNIKYIFCEELVSKKVAETLASEAGAELLELNPIEGLTDEEIANGDNYVSIMNKNLDNLKIALGAN